MGGGFLPFILKGGERMTVYEALVVAISFSTLIVAVLSFHHKK